MPSLGSTLFGKFNPNHDDLGRFSSGDGDAMPEELKWGPEGWPPFTGEDGESWEHLTDRLLEHYPDQEKVLAPLKQAAQKLPLEIKGGIETYAAAFHGDEETDLVEHYEVMNDLLRGRPHRKPVAPGQLRESQEAIPLLQKAFESMPLTKGDLLLFRGLSGKIGGQIKPGDVLEDKGFQSTSQSPSVAARFGSAMLVIQAPKGTRALPISELKDVQGENEIILPPRAKLRVRQVVQRWVAGEKRRFTLVFAEHVP